MKTYSKILLLLAISLSLKSAGLLCQDSIDNKMKLLDLKLQLLDSKLELLDSRIESWEDKPKKIDRKLEEMDMAYRQLDTKILTLDFDPAEFNYRFSLLDSMMKSQKRNIAEPKISEIVSLHYDTIRPRPFNSVIS